MNNSYKNFILEGKILKKIYYVYAHEDMFKNINDDDFFHINDSLEEILETIDSIVNICNETFNKNIDYKLSLYNIDNSDNLIFRVKIDLSKINDLSIKIDFTNKKTPILTIDLNNEDFKDFLRTKRAKNKDLIINSLSGTDNKVHFYHALSILMGTLS